MKLMLSLLFSCISSFAFANDGDAPTLKPAESFEQLSNVEQFLGMGYDDHRGPGRHPRYPDHPRRPGYPGYPGYPDHPRRPPREYICYTENARRITFWARDYSPRFAQRIATEQCYRYSRFCYELGCEVYRY